MKIKVKVKEVTKGCKFEIIEKGDWIDLKAAEDMVLKAPQAEVLKYKGTGDNKVGHRDVTFDSHLIKLGIAMQLPKGHEAIILPRSGTYKEVGVMCRNSMGVIDNSYKGDNDIWRFTPLAMRDVTIHKGDRICQFRLQLNQKATVWQKLKWLFTSGYKFEWVDSLDNKDRGGFNSTGVK